MKTKTKKKNNDIIFQKIDSQLIGFDINKSSLYTLNETAEIIYKKTKKGMKEKEIAQYLTKKYDIDLKTALADVRSTVSTLQKNRLL